MASRACSMGPKGGPPAWCKWPRLDGTRLARPARVSVLPKADLLECHRLDANALNYAKLACRVQVGSSLNL